MSKSDGISGVESGNSENESDQRFADGTRYRIEIPSTEGPRALRAVIEEAHQRGIRVQRVSQGSGIMMLSDSEIREMVRMGFDSKIEVSLFLGPRGSWSPGAQAAYTQSVAGAARGVADLAACLAEAKRACELGIRSVLVADLGVLDSLAKARDRGDLPPNLLLKTSVLLPVTNPATAAVVERLGAGSINVGTDLSADQLGEMRRMVSIPLDVYIEAPDDQGGFVRYYEAPGIIRAASPIYLKFGIRNSPGIYPAGKHLDETTIELARERVRRAELCIQLLARFDSGLNGAPSLESPSDLAIPEL